MFGAGRAAHCLAVHRHDAAPRALHLQPFPQTRAQFGGIHGLEHPAERVRVGYAVGQFEKPPQPGFPFPAEHFHVRKVLAVAYDSAQTDDYYVLEFVEHVPVGRAPFVADFRDAFFERIYVHAQRLT